MSAPPPQQQPFSYLPAPHEREYYGTLFAAADDERMGSIGGAKAVAFFTRSKLPITILKDIWTVADQPPTNALDPMKFAVAIRLIQCEQNGIHLSNITSTNLSQGVPPNLRPAIFEGIPPPPSPPPGAPAQPTGPVHPSVPLPPTRPSVMNNPMQPPPQTATVAHDNTSVTGGGSVASRSVPYPNHQLTVQDPYILTPSEQARYEQIFPEYAQNDPNGKFMSGSEAVALFSKSGLSQPILAQIWNMVDTNPVDNQLDIIEFVLAMHLIVCISKKNLPVPPNLPLSLKNIKAQHAQQQQNNAPVPQTIYQQNSVAMQSTQTPNLTQVQSQQTHAPVMETSPMGVVNMNMPQPHGTVNASTMNSSGMHQPELHPPPQTMSMAANAPTSLSGVAGPPPLSKPGGVSISDAFEGLDGIGGTSDMVQNHNVSSLNYNTGDTGSISSYNALTPPPPTNHANFSTVSDVVESIPEPTQDHRGAAPVMETKHHSNNVDKSYVESYNMGESSVELKKLKEALQKLQAENISLKASMGSLSLEEQEVQKELNATIAEVTKLSNDLTKTRAQVLASKSRLLQATAELKAAKEKTTVLQDLISDATMTKQAIDEAHESIENANELLARSNVVGNTTTFQSNPAPTIVEEDLFGGWGADDSGAVNAPLPALGSGNFNSTLASSTEGTNYSNPPPSQMETLQPSISSPMPSHTYNSHTEPIPPTASTNMYNGGGYSGGSTIGHNRDTSGNDFGEVMGSSPSLQSPLAPILQYDSGFGSSMGAQTYDSIPHVTSLKEVEDLKAKSKEADDVAKDAEASRRQLVAQLEELRKLADEAESKARAASEKPTKKKGILGRGGSAQKKDAKEIERLLMDARDKKEAMLNAQAQVKDAESLAIATKREAERLFKEAEDAQMSAAAAASMSDQNKQQNQMTVSTIQSPRYDIPSQGGIPMQVYDNPSSTGIDYSNPFG